MKVQPIRLQVGFNRLNDSGNYDGFGLIHIKKREKAIQNLGYESVEQYLEKISQNYDKIYDISTEKKPNRFLITMHDEHYNSMPVDFIATNDGKCYTIVSAFARGLKREEKQKGKVIFDRSASLPSASNNSRPVQNGNTDENVGISVQSATEKSTSPIENISQSNNEGKTELQRQLYEKIKADEHPELKKLIDYYISVFYNAKMKKAEKNSDSKKKWDEADGTIAKLLESEFDDNRLTVFEDRAKGMNTRRERRDINFVQQKLYEKFNFEKYPTLKKYIDIKLDKVRNADDYFDRHRSDLMEFLDEKFSETELELRERFCKWAEENSVDVFGDNSTDTTRDIYNRCMRLINDLHWYWKAQYHSYDTDNSRKEANEKYLAFEKIAHQRMDDIFSGKEREKELETYNLKIKKPAEKAVEEFIKKAGVKTTDDTTKYAVIVKENIHDKGVAVAYFDKIKDALDCAKYVYEKTRPNKDFDSYDVEIRKNFDPKANYYSKYYSVSYDERHSWIQENKFVYDENKSVEENMEAAEKIAQEYLDNFGITANINSPERIALRREIIEELYGNGAKNKERKAFLVMGLPASGKSTIAETVAKENGALIIDSDMAKEKLSEFNGGLFTTPVHEESAHISDAVLSCAVNNGDNIVYPMVGTNEIAVKDRIAKLNAAGYEVNLYYVDLPTDKALERVKNRFKETGRIISTKYLESVGNNSKENFDRLKKSEGVKSYAEWSNEVDRGQRPRLFEDSAEKSQIQSGLGFGRNSVNEIFQPDNGQGNSQNQGERTQGEKVNRQEDNKESEENVTDDSTNSVVERTGERNNQDAVGRNDEGGKSERGSVSESVAATNSASEENKTVETEDSTEINEIAISQEQQAEENENPLLPENIEVTKQNSSIQKSADGKISYGKLPDGTIISATADGDNDKINVTFSKNGYQTH